MSLPGIHVDVMYAECGQVNAGYLSAGHRLLVCTEALELPPEVLRTIIAHEMGHAIIDQYNIPVTGSEEAAADELGAISQIAMGHSSDVEFMADFYNHRDDGGEDVEDDHQSSAKRAAVLFCLIHGADISSGDFTCRAQFVHTATVWLRLLSTFGPK